jgi:hypothetical protein
MKKKFLADMVTPPGAPEKKKPLDAESGDADMPMGDEADAEAPGPLADVSDDDLLAEAEKRGLKVSKPEPAEDEEAAEGSEDDFPDEEFEEEDAELDDGY